MNLLRWAVLSLAALLAPALAAADDDDAPAGDAAALPALTAEQQRAAGIVVAHPAAASLARREAAIGLVLDPADLIAQLGEADAAAAAARSAAAELARVGSLHKAGAGASQKALEAAQAEQARARSQADAAAAKVALRWRPVARMAAPARQKLVDALVAGRSLLVRADLAGRHAIGSVPERALLDVDGINVPGNVLGLVAQAGEEAQGAGVLIEVRSAPVGLDAGARVPLELLGEPRSGVLVPSDAVLYDEAGALVYRRLAPKTGDAKTTYAPVRVTLLQAQGDGWLVDGVDDDDDLVVHGAGVLWSLQGIVGRAAGDMDDD